MGKLKTNPEHKCKGVRVSYEASCTCGWKGDAHYGGQFGSGGRSAAYDQWRSHVARCEAASSATGGDHG